MECGWGGYFHFKTTFCFGSTNRSKPRLSLLTYVFLICLASGGQRMVSTPCTIAIVLLLVYVLGHSINNVPCSGVAEACANDAPSFFIVVYICCWPCIAIPSKPRFTKFEGHSCTGSFAVQAVTCELQIHWGWSGSKQHSELTSDHARRQPM